MLLFGFWNVEVGRSPGGTFQNRGEFIRRQIPQRTMRLKNKSSDNIIFQSESNEDAQQLSSAVYYEDPFTIREIELSEYVHEENMGYSIPKKVMFKRYTNTKLDQRSGENLVESYDYTLVSAKPKL